MPVYKYIAINSTGTKVTSVFTAKSQTEVISMLKEKNLYPVKIEEHIERKEIDFSNLFNKISTKDIAVLCRQFHTMLNAGVTITSALDILRQQTENKKLKNIISNIYEEVQKGSSISENFKKYDNVFPELLINMIEVGEISGNLDTIMERMANHYEKEFKINNKIKGAMIYPLVIGIVAVSVIIFLLIFVMPTFISMFAGSGIQLPLPTRIVLSISAALKNYWYLFFVIMLTTIFGIKYYFKTTHGKLLYSNLNLKIPIIKSSNVKIITSRFTRTLATLLASGVSLIEALHIASKVVGNLVIESEINEVIEAVKKGSTLATSIRNIGFFPPMVTSMIEIGEESGALDAILEKTADFYDEELEAAIQKLTSLIEPVMIVLMAIIVGFIVIAMILPMFDMFNTIQI